MWFGGKSCTGGSGGGASTAGACIICTAAPPSTCIIVLPSRATHTHTLCHTRTHAPTPIARFAKRVLMIKSIAVKMLAPDPHHHHASSLSPPSAAAGLSCCCCCCCYRRCLGNVPPSAVRHRTSQAAWSVYEGQGEDALQFLLINWVAFGALQFLLINWVAFGQCRGCVILDMLTHMLPWHRLLLSPAGHRVSGSASRLRLRLRSVARSTYMRLLFRAVVVDHGNNTH